MGTIGIELPGAEKMQLEELFKFKWARKVMRYLGMNISVQIKTLYNNKITYCFLGTKTLPWTQANFNLHSYKPGRLLVIFLSAPQIMLILCSKDPGHSVMQSDSYNEEVKAAAQGHGISNSFTKSPNDMFHYVLHQSMNARKTAIELTEPNLWIM